MWSFNIQRNFQWLFWRRSFYTCFKRHLADLAWTALPQARNYVLHKFNNLFNALIMYLSVRQQCHTETKSFFIIKEKEGVKWQNVLCFFSEKIFILLSYARMYMFIPGVDPGAFLSPARLAEARYRPQSLLSLKSCLSRSLFTSARMVTLMSLTRVV